MSKRRRGSIQRRDGKWWARVTFTGEDEKRHEKRRLAKSKPHAAELVRQLLNDADKTDGRSLSHEAKTFEELADLFEQKYLVPVEYDPDGKKISGMRGEYRQEKDGHHRGGKGSLYTAKLQLKMLREEFGDRRLRSFTYPDLRDFRARRFQTPTKPRRCPACNGKRAPKDAPPCGVCNGSKRVAGKRTWATVNRELTMLNRMFNVARQLGWIVENPFKQGDESLVKLSKENKRDIVLGRDDETRLLAACNESTLEGRRLRAILVCAGDTGMRQGEIFALQWSDVDLNARVIRVRAENTKTLTERRVPITARLREELIAWRQAFAAGDDEPLFGYTANVKRNYGRARVAVGLQHVRFHDLRHTAATRMIQGGMPVAEVGRILGHTDLSRLLMTYRYINTDDTTLTRAAAILDAAHEITTKQQQAATPAAAVN